MAGQKRPAIWQLSPRNIGSHQTRHHSTLLFEVSRHGIQWSGGVYSLLICIHVSSFSAKPLAKLPRCAGYLPRACFCISLHKCFLGPSAGKLLLETEEDSFREGIRVHDLLVNVICNSHPNETNSAMRKSTTFLLRAFCGKHLPQTFRGCSASLPFLLICQHLYMFA